MKTIHGDYLLYKGFNLLSIGYNHDDGIRCLPYYKDGKKLHYLERNPLQHPELSKKVRLDKRFQHEYVFLDEDEVEMYYVPEEKLGELFSRSKLNKYEQVTVDFANLLLEAGLKLDEMGISGSVLLGKEKANDIDFSIYGTEASFAAISYLEGFEFPMEKFIEKKRFIDPAVPVNISRYANYALYKGMMMDMFYKFGRRRLEEEDFEYVKEWETELRITDSRFRLFKPTIIQAATPDEEVEIFSYATYMHLVEDDVVHFRGKMFSRNGKKVAGLLNPNTEKISVVSAGEDAFPDAFHAQCGKT